MDIFGATLDLNPLSRRSYLNSYGDINNFARMMHIIGLHIGDIPYDWQTRVRRFNEKSPGNAKKNAGNPKAIAGNGSDGQSGGGLVKF